MGSAPSHPPVAVDGAAAPAPAARFDIKLTETFSMDMLSACAKRPKEEVVTTVTASSLPGWLGRSGPRAAFTTVNDDETSTVSTTLTTAQVK